MCKGERGADVELVKTLGTDTVDYTRDEFTKNGSGEHYSSSQNLPRLERCRPVIDRSYRLERIAEAFKHV
jgi:hypothetical protein